MDQTLRYPLGFLLGRATGSVPAHYRTVPFPAPLSVNSNTKLGCAANDRGAIAVIGEAIHPDATGLDHEGVARMLLDHFDDRQAQIDKLIVNHRTDEADIEYAIRAVERLRTRYLAGG